MIELLVAILIAIGSLTSGTEFTTEYKETHQAEVARAQQIIDGGYYHIDERTGGVTVDTGVGL